MTLFPNKLLFCGAEGLGLQPMNWGRGGYNLNCNSILPLLEETLKILPEFAVTNTRQKSSCMIIKL